MSVKSRLNSPPIEELYGKMFVDVINIFAGFSGYYGGLTPYLKQILLVHYDDVCRDLENAINEECVSQIDFYRLFYSYPPYEPITYPPVICNDVELYGDRIWFISVKELFQDIGSNRIMRYLTKKLARLGIASVPASVKVFFGDYDEYYDEILIRKVITFRIVGDCSWFLRVDFRDEHNKKVRIYYGFHKLLKYLKKIGCEKPSKLSKENLRKATEQATTELGYRSRYKPEYLNYITWCYAGRVISTDPVAPLSECDFCVSNYGTSTTVGPCYGAPGGRVYHYSRKIFPKVVVEIRNDLDFQLGMPLVPFSVEVFAGRKLTSRVERLAMTLPKGRSLSLTPTKKPFTVLRRTNGLVVTVSEPFIRSLIHFMENYVIYSNKKLNKKFTLLHMLVSKYHVQRGNPFKLSSVARVQFRDNRLHVDVSNLEKIYGDFADYLRNRRYLSDDNFLKFVGENLMHTLAHALLIILSEELNLGADDLTYVYGSKTIKVQSDSGKDEFMDVFYVAITEKNDMGTLQMDVELNKILGSETTERIISLSKRLKEFWNDVKNALDEYYREFSRISGEIAEGISGCNEARVIAHVAKRILYELLSKEFLPDVDMLKQIIVSAITDNLEATRKYIEAELGKTVSISELEDIIDRYIDDIITYLMDEIDPCIDGCNIDVRLDKLCSKALFENLYISRNLLKLFLEVAGIIDYHELEVDGEGLFKLVTAVKNNLYIQTAFTSTQALYALKDILRRDVKVILEIDKRRINAYLNTLKKIAHSFSNFKFKETEKSHHGKALIIDLLEVVTSWNYGTSGYPLQNYRAVLKGLDEE